MKLPHKNVLAACVGYAALLALLVGMIALLVFVMRTFDGSPRNVEPTPELPQHAKASSPVPIKGLGANQRGRESLGESKGSGVFD